MVTRILGSLSNIPVDLTESNYEHDKRLSHGRSPRPSIAESRIDYKTRGSGVRGRRRIAFTKAKKNEIPKTRIVNKKDTRSKSKNKRFNSKSLRSISPSPRSRSISTNRARRNPLVRKASRDALPKTVIVKNKKKKRRSQVPISSSFVAPNMIRTPRSGNKRIAFNYSNQKSGNNSKIFINNNDSPSKRYKNRGYPSPVSGAQTRDFSNFKKHEMDFGYMEMPISSFHNTIAEKQSNFYNRDQVRGRSQKMIQYPKKHNSKNPYFVLKDRNRSKDVNRTPSKIGALQQQKNRNNNGYNVYGVKSHTLANMNQYDRRKSRTPQKSPRQPHSRGGNFRNEDSRRRIDFESRNMMHRRDRSRSKRNIQHRDDMRSRSRSPYGHEEFAYRRQARENCSPRDAGGQWGWGGNGGRMIGQRR